MLGGEAIQRLSKRDHYLVVMIQRAGLRPPGDLLKLWGAGFATVAVLACAVFILAEYNIDFEKYFPSRDELRFAIWATVASLAVGYVLLRLLLGAQRIDHLTGQLLEWVFRNSRRDK
jgi:hypothetical protein